MQQTLILLIYYYVIIGYFFVHFFSLQLIILNKNSSHNIIIFSKTSKIFYSHNIKHRIKNIYNTFDISLLFNVESFAVSFVRGAFLVLLISCTKARIRC